MNSFARKLSGNVCEAEGGCLGVVNVCNNLLLHKKFEKCLETCQLTITQSKNFPEKPGSYQLIESLCVLAIQAYAELDRWQEALPFVTGIYSGIEDCPAQVVQLCVLLHAHMQDFASCNAVSTIWLRNPSNFSDPKYHILVEIFLAYVLLPQCRWKDVGPFLQNCAGLQQDVRLRYQTYMLSLQEKKELEKRKRVHEMEKKKLAKEQSQRDSKKTEPEKSLIKQLVAWLTHYIPPVKLHFIKNLALFSIFLYWIITRANIGMLSNERILAILSSVIRIWKAMFSPFHLTNQ